MSETTSAQTEKRQRVMGWVAVALSTLATSVLGIVAGEEVVMRDWPAALSHAAQMLVVIVATLVALRWPRVGGSLLVLAGLGFMLQLTLGLIALFSPAAPLLLLLIVAGVLYFYSRPRPRRLTYVVIAVVPLVLFGITSFLPGPGEELPVQRVSPAAEAVMVNSGHSLIFTAAAQDPDGDLRALEWSVSGPSKKAEIRRRVDLAGSQAQDSFELAFPDAGSFGVSALFTAASGQTGEAYWLVTVKPPRAD